jgi:hypothetical protein
MEISEILDGISIGIEIIAVFLGIAIAARKGRQYGWFVASTFALYVCYDFIRLSGFGIPAGFLSVIFLIASLSVLAALLLMYQEK